MSCAAGGTTRVRSRDGPADLSPPVDPPPPSAASEAAAAAAASEEAAAAAAGVSRVRAAPEARFASSRSIASAPDPY